MDKGKIICMVWFVGHSVNYLMTEIYLFSSFDITLLTGNL